MTVASEEGRSGPYIGNGSATVFPYDFRILSGTHLRVIRTQSGIETVLTLGDDYTVSGVGDDDGSITMGSAPTASQTITMMRDVPFTQETDLENQGAYYAETIEDALDLAAMRDQQLKDRSDRALALSETSSYANLVLPDPVAGKYVKWRADLLGLENSEIQLPVGNFALATQSEAEVGTNHGVLMTPLRTSQNVAATRFPPTRTALKALDTTTITAAYLREVGREGQFIWRTGDYSAKVAADPYEGIYVKADAISASVGAWVRDHAPGRYHINWFGAKEDGATDILAIFNSAKMIAAGGELVFGQGPYYTSDSLFYEAASNKPLLMFGTIGGTDLRMAATGFAIKYYGVTGGGNEARGGGVMNFKISKTGGGTCSGIDIANVYRGNIQWNETTGCGNIGIRITGRGAGDTDATAGTLITQNRCRDGVIGIQIRGDTSGSVVAAEIEISRNNCDGNATCGIWIACADKVVMEHNTVTACGDGAGGTLNERGCLFIEYFGGHVRNVVARYNEFGNTLAGAAAFNVIIDALIGGIFELNRHIRNTGEGGRGAYLLGFVQTTKNITSVRFERDYFVASGAAAYTLFNGGGTTMVFSNNSIIDPQFIDLGGSVTKYAVSAFAAIFDNAALTSTRLLNIESAATSVMNRITTDGGVFAFQRAGVQVGSITVTSSATAFATSSDANLKINDGEMSLDLAREIMRLIVIHDFRWKSTGAADHGVFAQELFAIYPAAVTQGHEEPGDDDYMPWQVDYSKLMPPVIRAVQGLDARLAALEAKAEAQEAIIAAMKAALTLAIPALFKEPRAKR